MALVHLLPTAAGGFLSLLDLNTFTFQRLFGAPWTGFGNYDSILFDSANPLHSGFTTAAGNTAFYTAWTVGGTLLIGLGIPFAMLIFLAGLQAIPRELHEAAAIDGAGAWQRFRHITLPLLRPLIAIQLLFGVIYSAYQFTIPYIMLGTNPGPSADLLMTLVIRQSFSNNLFGYGAAVSTLLMLAMLVWVAIWYRAFRRDFAEAG